MPRVVLNIDLGELPDEPEAFYAIAHIANIACGGHAGDERSMVTALASCRRHDTAVSAHPSYPDRANFGRTAMALTDEALRASVGAQCGRLADLARDAGLVVKHVKAHGALYHAAQRDRAVADVLVDAARRALGPAITFIGPSGGALAEVLARANVPLLREGFADRNTRADGSLVPRGEPDALVTDPARAAERAKALARAATVETICVHGDTPGAVSIARAVRDALDAWNATA